MKRYFWLLMAFSCSLLSMELSEQGEIELSKHLLGLRQFDDVEKALIDYLKKADGEGALVFSDGSKLLTASLNGNNIIYVCTVQLGASKEELFTFVGRPISGKDLFEKRIAGSENNPFSVNLKAAISSSKRVKMGRSIEQTKQDILSIIKAEVSSSLKADSGANPEQSKK